MSKRTETLAHDWFCDKPNRQGKPERQVIANGTEQMSYSYNSIWTYTVKLALKDDRNKVLLLNDNYYSNTSREHKWQVEGACPYSTKTIRLYHGLEYLFQEEEVKSAIYSIDQILKKQLKARSKYYLDEIGPIISNIERFQGYLRNKNRVYYQNIKPLRKNHKLLQKMYALAATGKDLESLKDYTSVIEQQKKRDAANRRKLFKKQLEAKTKTHNKWYEDSSTEPTKLKEGHVGVYLKVIEDKLVTSNSIRVSLKEATLLYKRWVAGKDIVGLKLEHYTVVSSTKEKVKIGCTTIGSTELNKVLGKELD